MYKFHIIITLLMGLFLQAQEEMKRIDGAVQFDYSGVDYSNIIITNINSGSTTSTNILGQFSILAKEGDILEAKGVNIFTDLTVIKSSNYEKGIILILLEPLVIPLSGIKVTGFKFTGNLEVDTKKVKIRDSLDDAIAMMGIPIGKKRDEWKHINTPIMSSILSLDIDALGDAITGEKKRKIALYNFNKKKNIVDKVREYFKDDLFTEQLQIPFSEIDPFIFTLIEVENLETYFNAGDYYTILSIMKEFSPIYKKRLLIRDAKQP